MIRIDSPSAEYVVSIVDDSGYESDAFVNMDYAATTPIDPAVAGLVSEILQNHAIGNPHAKHHTAGVRAAAIVEEARWKVAQAVGASAKEIIFTSGATESNNTVFQGLLDSLIDSGRNHVVTSAVEHSSVLGPLEFLRSRGLEVSLVEPKPCGMIEADMLARALRPNTGLVSIQAVNNELGTIQPLSEIRQVLNRDSILFHTDASQALGKIPFDVTGVGVDFASFSSHKIYGPQGVGALFVSASKASLLEPILRGGGQQTGLRSGTVPVALTAGFGLACSLLVDDRNRLQTLRSILLDSLSELSLEVYGHSDPDWNVPGILSLRIEGIDNETLSMELQDLAFGQGAACSSSKREASKGSHVIWATTRSEAAASETIRLSFGRFTTEFDIAIAASRLCSAVSRIREIQGDY